MAVFGVGHQFYCRPSQSFGGAGVGWSTLGLKVAMEIYHQPSRAGRVDLHWLATVVEVPAINKAQDIPINPSPEAT